MIKPRIVLFTELDAQPLRELLAQPGLVGFLAEQKLGISMGMRDFSAERAEGGAHVERVAVPVHAWLLLPTGILVQRLQSPVGAR